MPAPKAKAPVKKAKATARPKAKAKIVKTKAKPKVVAKAQPKKVLKAKPAHRHMPQGESVFARLLREKAERHAQFQKDHGHLNSTGGPNGAHQPMPSNHAKFSRFAGPRRRAS